MAAEDRIEELLAPIVEDLGYEYVGLEYSSNPKNRLLRLYIDEPEKGIDVDDCAKVSREVSAIMDVEEPISGQYTLEVSSPGVERPLFTAEQFSRFVGETAKVQMFAPVDGRRRFKGTIVAVDGDIVRLLVDATEYELDVSGMDKARLAPDLDALFADKA
ncbi:MAG: ribosome maturation factor RimP [Pseudomonadota bacterium]